MDFELKLKSGLRRGAFWTVFAGAALAGFEVVNTGIIESLPSLGYPGLDSAVATLVAPALLYPARRRVDAFAERLAERAMPNVHETPEYLAMRKLTVYRAAVAAAARDGLSAAEEAQLTQLAAELEIPASLVEELLGEHRVEASAAKAPVGEEKPPVPDAFTPS